MQKSSKTDRVDRVALMCSNTSLTLSLSSGINGVIGVIGLLGDRKPRGLRRALDMSSGKPEDGGKRDRDPDRSYL